jgi:hypothetical protein
MYRGLVKHLQEDTERGQVLTLLLVFGVGGGCWGLFIACPGKWYFADATIADYFLNSLHRRHRVVSGDAYTVEASLRRDGLADLRDPRSEGMHRRPRESL